LGNSKLYIGNIDEIFMGEKQSTEAQITSLYLSRDLNNWFELVSNYWYNWQDYKGVYPFENNSWGSIRGRRDKNRDYLQILADMILYGIVSIFHNESKDIASMRRRGREKLVLAGATPDNVKEFDRRFFDAAKEFYWKHNGGYEDKENKTTGESGFSSPYYWVASIEEIPTLIPRNKKVYSIHPLIFPFFNNALVGCKEEPSDELKKIAQKAGKSAALQNVPRNLLPLCQEVDISTSCLEALERELHSEN